MQLTVFLNTFGVVLATLGSVLAWYFLGQIDYTDRKEFLKGNSVMTVHEATPEKIAALRWNLRLSRFGIALIVIGGLLQGGSNFAPANIFVTL